MEKYVERGNTNVRHDLNMDWATLKREVYFEDGSFRDVFVLGSEKKDWRKWVDATNKKYQVEFYDGDTEQTTDKIDFEKVESYWNGKGKNWVSAHVILGTVRVHCAFLNDPEIEFDVHPTDFKSIADHNLFVEYLMDISITLDKDILVTDEGADVKLMTVKKNNLVLNRA